MSDLIRGLARKQQTSFLRPQGSPVHYTDGTVMPEADSNAYESYANAADGIQPPDMAPPFRPVRPNPYANTPVEQAPDTNSAAWGQENYGHMMAQRRAAYDAEMARRRGG